MLRAFLSRRWNEFVLSISLDDVEVSSRPANVLFVAGTFVMFALLLHFVPFLRRFSGLSDWQSPSLLAVGAGAASLLLTLDKVRQSRKTVALVQCVDTPLYGASVLTLAVLCHPPVGYVFWALYFFMLFYWSNIFAWSAVSLWVVASGPVAVLAIYRAQAAHWFFLVVAMIAFVNATWNTAVRRKQALLQASERQMMSRQVQRASRFASLGTLTGGLAHEINNPLSIMLLGLESLRARPALAGDQEAEKLFQRIFEAGARIRSVLEGIVGMARAGNLKEKEWISLESTIRGLLLVIEPVYATEGIQLSFESGAGASLVHANRGRLQQAVLNILENSRLAIRPKRSGRIDLSLAQERERLVLTVTDNGCGIAQEHLDRIFDAFFTTRMPNEGTGLGLWIVYTVAHEMGGAVEARSEAGKGTEIRIELPRAPSGPHESGRGA